MADFPILLPFQRHLLIWNRMHKRTSILCVAPFYNPYILPIYDEMAMHKEVEVVRVSLRSLPPARRKLGWPEMAPDAPYLQPWRSLRDRQAYYEALLQADVAVMPGFFHFYTLPFHHWLRRLTGKVTLLWSEPFLGHPRTLSQSAIRGVVKKLLLLPCNSAKYHLLATGYGSESDWCLMGMTRWKAWIFCFATSPQVKRPNDVSRRRRNEIHILYCGSLIHRKGVDLLINALGNSNIRRLNWRLTLVGDGDMRSQLEAAANGLGIGDRVTFTGALSSTQCQEVLRTGHMLVLPSRYDGWGAVVNEAMEWGMAVVVSDAVGARRPLVVDGVNGRVFRNDDAESLASVLFELLADRSRIQAMGEASKQRILLFRPSEVARRLAVLCSALAGHAPMPNFSDELLRLI